MLYENNKDFLTKNKKLYMTFIQIVVKSINFDSEIDYNKLKTMHEILKYNFKKIEINNKLKLIGIFNKNFIINLDYEINKKISSYYQTFDLSKSPLIKIGFNKEKNLIIIIHKTISDNISINIYIKELIKLYKGESLQDLQVKFKDYCNKCQEESNANILTNQDILDKEFILSNIPRVNNTIIKYEIKDLYFFDIYGFIMHKYSAQDNIYTSLVNINRDNEAENFFGMFIDIQTFLIKFDVNNNISLREIIQNINKDMNLCRNKKIISINQTSNNAFFIEKDVDLFLKLSKM
ncbi:hypothetical protein H8356DRAFT_1430166 [Neocallimastix lanati (nom. inval.)]|nr:hypothetical protein H8356DRAFT_1430166 [Neocallimastix sp. JGI-2020a]